MSRKRIKRIILGLFLMSTIVVAILPFLLNSPTTASASMGFCSGIGNGMGNHKNVSSDVIAPNAKGRKWTAQELFGKSISYTAYQGEGEGDFILADLDPDRGAKTPGWEEFSGGTGKDVRGVGRCMTGALKTAPGQVFQMLASMFTEIANIFVSKMFSGGVICTDPNGDNTGCINLLGTIGGTGSNDQGIIGSLRDSVFTPLVSIAFVLVGLWVMYKGLIQRQFRNALGGFLWSLGIFIVGGILMWNPMLLASLPQKTNSAITTCIVGAMNGQSCLTGEVTAPSSVVGPECMSSAEGSGTEGAALAANAMNCSIWKTFVLDSWARGQFGVGYNDLYLKDAPEGKEVWKHAPENVEDFGVSMKSSGSATDYRNKTVKTSGDKVYNLALYQLYISTNVQTDGDSLFTTKADDPRWFNIAVPASKDPTVWNAWLPNTGGAFTRFFLSLGSAIIAGMVSISLVVFAFWGMVYMFAGTILMTFAPFFFLLGVEPGKGRRMFLGWLESVTSSVLKYMASSLLVIVALTLYASILGSTDSYATAFLGITIMVGVLSMYRKEIVNILGMSNLGGQKLSNAVGEKISHDAKKTKEFATVTGGGAAGAYMAARKMGKTRGQAMGDSVGGAAGAAKQAMKRGTGARATAMRQYDSTMRDLERDQAEQDKLRNETEKEMNEQKQGAETPTTGGKTGGNGGSNEKGTKSEEKSTNKESNEVTETNDIKEEILDGTRDKDNNKEDKSKESAEAQKQALRSRQEREAQAAKEKAEAQANGGYSGGYNSQSNDSKVQPEVEVSPAVEVGGPNRRANVQPTNPNNNTPKPKLTVTPKFENNAPIDIDGIQPDVPNGNGVTPPNTTGTGNVEPTVKFNEKFDKNDSSQVQPTVNRNTRSNSSGTQGGNTTPSVDPSKINRKIDVQGNVDVPTGNQVNPPIDTTPTNNPTNVKVTQNERRTVDESTKEEISKTLSDRFKGNGTTQGGSTSTPRTEPTTQPRVNPIVTEQQGTTTETRNVNNQKTEKIIDNRKGGSNGGLGGPSQDMLGNNSQPNVEKTKPTRNNRTQPKSQGFKLPDDMGENVNPTKPKPTGPADPFGKKK